MMQARHRGEARLGVAIAAMAALCHGSAAAPAQLAAQTTRAEPRTLEHARWRDWLSSHRPTGYATPEAEAAARAAWTSNDVFIQQTNRRNLSFTVGHNQFSDLTTTQFAALLSRRGAGAEPLGAAVAPAGEMLLPPPSVDWETAGRVTPVMNEGQCGSSPFLRSPSPLSETIRPSPPPITLHHLDSVAVSVC